MTAAFDLHVHTVNSDGLAAPEAVLDVARDRGLCGLAFTDHSRATYSPALVEEARARGLRLLFPALEASTAHDGNKFHVLVYGPGVLDPGFAELAFQATATKNAIYERMIDELRAEGRVLPRVADLLAGAAPGRPPGHPDKWMLSKTLIGGALAPRDEQEAAAVKADLSARYECLKRDHPDRYPDTGEVIRAARDVHALPVLAHPWWECASGRNEPARVERQVRELAGQGLLGLEVVSRHFRAEDETRARALASELGLLPFAGTDFHANGKGELGDRGLSERELARVIDRAGAAGCVL